ncbi:hypothetical protein [Hymenobacter psychrophilus]|uniref:Uncharacterized protein n=1 Tax=Hymenobacter psychrophilus TaxID=651662 RepID=A0A1H3KX32_9BACT|nr:hypothetical protein [Hymenobacter psychrophilus]SDY56711.1 hypothetical protein SAMN04488069_1104 [Hymenobacter psychrophilus]
MAAASAPSITPIITLSEALPVRLGVINKIHGDGSGSIRIRSGELYRFHANGVWKNEAQALRAGLEVVFELNTKALVARAVRKLTRSKIIGLTSQRWIPAMVTGRGVVATRFAFSAYLSVAQVEAHQLTEGMMLLVRVSLSETYASVPQVLELQIVSGEQAGRFGQALASDDGPAQLQRVELEKRIAAIGPVGTEQQAQTLVHLLQLRNGYSHRPLGRVLNVVTPHWGLQLQALGYGMELAPSSLLITLVADADFTTQQLPDYLLAPYSLLRLERLKNIITTEARDELLALHRLGQQRNQAVFSQEALAKISIAEPYTFDLWLEGLAVPHPQLAVIVQMLLQPELAKEQEIGVGRLLQRCQQAGIALQVCQQVLSKTPDEALAQEFLTLRSVLDKSQQLTLLADIRHRVSERQVDDWWEQKLIEHAPAARIAKRIVRASADYQAETLVRYHLLEGSSMALVAQAKQTVLSNQHLDSIYSLIKTLQRGKKGFYRWGHLAKDLEGWADTTLRAIRKLSDFLPAEQQVSWWLQGAVGQPKAKVLNERLPLLAEMELKQVWSSLSVPAVEAVVNSLAGWLARDLPVNWTKLALVQLQKRRAEGIQRSRQQLQRLVVMQLSADLQIAFWQQGLTDQPEDAVLGQLLNQADTKQTAQLLPQLSQASLPGVIPLLFDRLVTELDFAEQVLRRLHFEASVVPPQITVLQTAVYNCLTPILSPALYLQWWLAGWLPSPSVSVLAVGLTTASPLRRAAMLEYCDQELLQQYGQCLAEPVDSVAKPEQGSEEIVHDVVAQLLARFPVQEKNAEVITGLLQSVATSTQLQWWMQGLNIAIDWQVLEQGLEQEALRLQLLPELAKRRLAELLAYLPRTTAELLPEFVLALTSDSVMGRHPAGVQVAALVRLAQLLCQEADFSPTELRQWLTELQRRCRHWQLRAAYDAYCLLGQDAPNPPINWLVDEQITPNLSAEDLLLYWQADLINYFPLVPLQEIACWVASQPHADLPQLHKEASIPVVVLQAWQSLATLRGQMSSQLKIVAALHVPALAFLDLLSAIVPWLAANLTGGQLEQLWIYGYPLPEPRNWSEWKISTRLRTVLLRTSNYKQELPARFAPNAEEIREWLSAQYWEDGSEVLAKEMYALLRGYEALAVVELPTWQELEQEFTLRCASVVKVRVWMSLPAQSQQRLFNYYAFRRGYSRLRAAEQRDFLRIGRPYLEQTGKTEQDYNGALHLRHRSLLRQQDGVAVYRMSLAHCYCPQEGYLEVELADKNHTIPCPFPEATPEWNARFLQMPWAACPVLVHVDKQTRELVKIQGLEAALHQFPTDQQLRAHYSFQRERKEHGTTDNPVAYWEDEQLHDELSSYLLELAEGNPFPTIVLTEKPVSRAKPLQPDWPKPKPEEEPVDEEAAGEEADELVLGPVVLPQQMNLLRIVDQEDIVFVWAPQFPHSNRATYVFRAPLIHHEQALGRLEYLLHNVGGIRSALLAPGPTSHRLRRHLGYVRTIRGKRGQAQAFEGWRKRLDAIIAAGPEQQHAYDPDSQFVPWELENPVVPGAPTATPELPATEPVLAELQAPDSQPAPPQLRAQQLLQQLQRFNSLFLAGYSS